MSPRAPEFVPSFDMAAPASGLLSPSPSMPDLSKAGETSDSQKGKETAAEPNGVVTENTEDVPLQSIEKEEDGAPEKKMEREGDKEAMGTLDSKEPTTRKNNKKKGLRAFRSKSPLRARDRSPVVLKVEERRVRRGSSSDSGSDSGSDSSSASFNPTTLSYPNRRRKYVEAYGEYMKSLEERITDLERERPVRSRRGSVLSIATDVPADVAKIAIPELKLMTWDEYLKDKGKPIPEVFHAIDVLIEEPILHHQSTRKKHSHEGEATGAIPEISFDVPRRCEGLPSRIRINSDMILQHLWRMSNQRFAAGKPFYPRTILRPYKVLYLMDSDIRKLLVQLEDKVRAKEQAPAEQPDVHEDPEQAIVTAGVDEAHIVPDNEKEVKDTKGHDNPPKEADKVDEKLPPGVVKIPEEDSEKKLDKENEEEKEKEKREEEGNERKDEKKDEKKDENKGEKKDEKEDKKEDEKKDEENEEKKGEKPKTFDERLDSEEALNDLRCLITFMDNYLKKAQDEFDKCERTTVRFSELWHLLKPDQLLYVNEKNCPQRIWRSVQVTGGRPYLSPWVPRPTNMPPPPPGHPDPPPSQENKLVPIAAGYDIVSPFCLDCEYLEYNGVRFGPIFRKFYIDPYEEEMDIEKLSCVPYRYAKKFGLVDEDTLKGRGEKFLQFIEPQHRYYSGRTLTRTPFGLPLMQAPDDYHYRSAPPFPVSEETVESEVMVDFDRTFQNNPKWSPRLGEDVVFELMDARECREGLEEGNAEDIDYDMKWDQQIRNDTMALINLQSSRYYSKEEVPTGNDLLLLPSRVYAFILRSRRWAALDIDNLRDIKARKNGFEDLELPSGHKDVVQALVQTHFRRKGRGVESSTGENEGQFDLVRDKGKGLIILLHGAPGVGKTSTAECVAESNNVPLLPITCGDLGITAQDVERKLEMNFRLAQAWGCVLLLDEADVFLAQRTSSDLERNAVVSVFLRVLEYYEGILFLTTNRVGAFDEAFKSRIKMSLFYPWLNAWQTTRIWEMQMRRIKESLSSIEIDTHQILEYAKLHFETQCRLTGGTGWNGRQIRNAFQSATALAQFECKSPSDPVHLQVRHFEIVAKAAAEFDDYLIRTTGHSDAERAAFNMMRTDSFNPSSSNPVSLESMMQARGYVSAASTHMASFGGSMGSQMPAQAAFGGSMRSNFGAGQPGMQGMNQGSFSMGMGQGMSFPQGGYSMAGPSTAQAAFLGGGQTGNPQQMWPMQNQNPSGMVGMQQGSLPSMSQQALATGQDGAPGQQQAQGQLPAQGQQTQTGNFNSGSGGGGGTGFQQYPQQGGQGYQM